MKRNEVFTVISPDHPFVTYCELHRFKYEGFSALTVIYFPLAVSLWRRLNKRRPVVLKKPGSDL